MSNAEQPLGIGIIGYGGFGQFLHRAWDGLNGIEVRAVADTNSDVQSELAKLAIRKDELEGAPFVGGPPTRRDPSGITFYTDWLELIADPKIDIVSIASPPFTHADMACAAMQAGKHVLIEKPAATSREDAVRIGAVARQTKRVVAVDYMLRFNPIIETLHSWARDGSFGALRRVVVENYAQDESLADTHWFWDPLKSGGILVEHAVHFIDLVNACTDGEPVFVDGLALRRRDGRTDRMGLTVIYDDGLVSQQYHAFSRPGIFEKTNMRFVFDLAQIEIEGWIPLSGRVFALVNPDTIQSLNRLPGFELDQKRPLADLEDESRPEGWGAASAAGGGSLQKLDEVTGSNNATRARPASQRGVVYSGGEPYGVTERIEGRFALPGRKSAVYAEALRLMMADLAAAVRHQNHTVRAGIREGLRSLDIALEATERAERLRHLPL